MSSNFKTISCTCGKEIIILEESIATKLCSLCPLKMQDFYILFKDKKTYVHIRARTKGDAHKLFNKTFFGQYHSTYESEKSVESRAEKKGETLIYKYHKDEIEDTYLPGDPRRKRKPRRQRKDEKED